MYKEGDRVRIPEFEGTLRCNNHSTRNGWAVENNEGVIVTWLTNGDLENLGAEVVAKPFEVGDLIRYKETGQVIALGEKEHVIIIQGTGGMPKGHVYDATAEWNKISGFSHERWELYPL